jgi:hypothetical protein
LRLMTMLAVPRQLLLHLEQGMEFLVPRKKGGIQVIGSTLLLQS